MRRSSWVVVGVIVALVAALAYARMAGRPELSDEEQIQALLTKGRLAIERKNLKDALSCISPSYSDSAGMKYDALRLQAASAFQERGQYEALLENTALDVKDRRAHVEVDVTLTLVSGGQRNRLYSGRMGLSLEKEASKRWLVIPVQTWKVTEISGLAGVTGEVGF